jgi:Na+-driven multidrug efflux pump
MCAEWWSFEITQILAGLMGEINLATQLITLQLVSVAFAVSNGIGVGEQ